MDEGRTWISKLHFEQRGNITLRATRADAWSPAIPEIFYKLTHREEPRQRNRKREKKSFQGAGPKRIKRREVSNLLRKGWAIAM